jgi:hypothetical protein
MAAAREPTPEILAAYDQALAGVDATLDTLVDRYRSKLANGRAEFGLLASLVLALASESGPQRVASLLGVAVRRLAASGPPCPLCGRADPGEAT